MRDIKFRAWYKEGQEMLAVRDINFCGEEIDTYEMQGDWIGFEYLELMQYTGLKDKNGKEIYEGDILRLWRSTGKNGELRGEYYKPLLVEYCELWTQFVVVDKPNKIQMGIWKEFGAFEVIGNIYENPELLKEESV